MGTLPSVRQPALFSYHIDLERRLGADHLLRRVQAALDLSFVLPTVHRLYGRSGNRSEDPRVILKMLLLLFLYDIPSERELMEQIAVRMDFLWFLGFDLETVVPNHSVLSKARKRWGTEVFERLFTKTVSQCAAVGLVDGRLLHVDSTMVKANADKNSVLSSGPELVLALRQAYQKQAAKLEVLETPAPGSAPAVVPEAPAPPVATPASAPEAAEPPPSSPATLKVLPAPPVPAGAETKKDKGKAAPANRTHVSTTDPEAELARSKNGLKELNYKDHRLVDDAHGVITAVVETRANVGDGSQLPVLYQQHLATTGLQRADPTIAGDGHYGTASNFIFCKQEGVRAHLGQVSAHLEEQGKLPPERFMYEAAQDRLRCPRGHYLLFHQDRPAEQAKVYLIEDAAHCAGCVLREQCTKSPRGRSIQRHVQSELIEASRAEAKSAAARYSRRRRQHVMEGSFADAAQNHGAKQARWRGLWRQKIQSWLIAAVQNLRILLRHQISGKSRAAVAALAILGESGWIRAAGPVDRCFWLWWPMGTLPR